MQTMPYNNPAWETLVVWCQRHWQNSNGVMAPETGWVGKNIGDF